MTALDRCRVSRMLALSRKCIAAVELRDWDRFKAHDRERARLYELLGAEAARAYLKLARALPHVKWPKARAA